MNPVLGAEITALLVLLGLSAFFSSAETSLFSLTPMQIHRIRRTHPKAARRIESMLSAPTDLLSSILIGNTIVNIAAASTGYAIAKMWIPTHAEAVAIPAMTVVLILFCEVTPKRLAVRRPENMAIRYVGILNGMVWLCTPLRHMLNRVTHAFAEHIRPRRTALNAPELLTAVDVGHEEGILSKEERLMVDGIIRLESQHARDVMTPRVDLTGIDLNADATRYVEICRRARFRYLPVYRGDLDHVEGFLDVARFLLSSDRDVKASMYPHFYVPDTAPLDTLLTMFQQQQRRLAIVIDEYGGTAGLVTRGDILDEIAEFAGAAPVGGNSNIEASGPNRWLVNGNVSLEAIDYELGLRLEAEGADRIAGWVTAHGGRIPRTGDVIEAQGCRVTVMQMRKHRIILVQVERCAPEITGEGDA